MHRLREIIGCPHCGLIQAIPSVSDGGCFMCHRCDHILERMNGRHLDTALICSITTLLLLFPANLLPMLQVDVINVTHRSVIASGVIGIWLQNWPLLAIAIGLEIILFPFLRFGLLSFVLSALKLGYRPTWLGHVFRWAEWLDEWAMMDVFLVGGIVGYARVSPFLPLHIEVGGYCMVATALLTLITRASLERRELWRAMGPRVTQACADMISCTACDYPVPTEQEGCICPRCGAKVWHCHPFSAMRAMALTIAAFIFYPAAYLYPMEYSDRLSTPHGYSIMTGVVKLMQAHLWFFAALIFFASVLIPLLKLFAFAWFGISIHRRSVVRLRLKTRLYRLISVIGRWSHIDVFTVSVFLPLLHLTGFLSTEVGRAMPAFLAVVVLTMLAGAVFDPRALWLAGTIHDESIP